MLFTLFCLGYKGQMTGHGFWGLASTILNENDFANEHIRIEALLPVQDFNFASTSQLIRESNTFSRLCLKPFPFPL